MFIVDIYDRVTEEHTRMAIGCAVTAEEMYDYFDIVCDTMMGMSVDLYQGDGPIDRTFHETDRVNDWLRQYHSRLC